MIIDHTFYSYVYGTPGEIEVQLLGVEDGRSGAMVWHSFPDRLMGSNEITNSDVYALYSSASPAISGNRIYCPGSHPNCHGNVTIFGHRNLDRIRSSLCHLNNVCVGGPYTQIESDQIRIINSKMDVVLAKRGQHTVLFWKRLVVPDDFEYTTPDNVLFRVVYSRTHVSDQFQILGRSRRGGIVQLNSQQAAIVRFSDPYRDRHFPVLRDALNHLAIKLEEL